MIRIGRAGRGGLERRGVPAAPFPVRGGDFAGGKLGAVVQSGNAAGMGVRLGRIERETTHEGKIGLGEMPGFEQGATEQEVRAGIVGIDTQDGKILLGGGIDLAQALQAKAEQQMRLRVFRTQLERQPQRLGAFGGRPSSQSTEPRFRSASK